MSDCPKQEKMQKSVSFPKVWFDEIEKIFNENKKDLAYYDITSPTGLLKSATMWGLPELLKRLSEVPHEEKLLSSLPNESRTTDDTLNKKKLENHQQ
jgi:hypothetical protein